MASSVVVYVLVAVLAVTWIVAIIQCCHICCHHKCLWRPHQVHTDAEDTLHEPPSRPPVVKSRLLKYGASSVVYQGSYSGRMAAIKIVHTHVPLVWENESQILSKTMAHDNVVEFVDAFRLESSYSMEMIIITNYYPLGSLYVHLSHNVLKWSTGLNAMCSFMRGLEYLHSSSPNKPSIAHCDIKSSNILVKDQELTCCICDFGIARRLDVLGKSTIKQIGTRQYLAPEVLAGQADWEDGNSLCKIDIYAAALVIWEVMTRCDIGDEVQQYSLPFSGVDDMKNTVVVKRERPPILAHWRSDMTQIMLAGWAHDPEQRPSSKDTLHKLENIFE